LAILILQVDAKKTQAEGALTSANAQYNMAVNGATDSQSNNWKLKKRTERTV
jgi:HlyD family secretion protein